MLPPDRRRQRVHRYPDWASVVERNELLLEQRGISAAVFAVDPSPYWAANGGLPPGPDPGMQELAAHLERAVLETEQLRISRALTETFWVADRLKMRLSAERAVIDNATRADAARTRLRSAAEAAHDLCSPDSAWLVRNPSVPADPPLPTRGLSPCARRRGTVRRLRSSWST